MHIDVWFILRIYIYIIMRLSLSLSMRADLLGAHWLPSGKRLQFAIEAMAIEIVDLPI